jgi:superfamily I DNA/RNA helicase
MKRRVSRLLEERVEPTRILALTFTRIAAASLVAELRAIGTKGGEKITAGTLHGFCFRLLQRNEVLEFLGRCPRPLLTYSDKAVLQFEASPLLADISQDGRRKGTKRIQAFEAAWARLQSEEPGWPPAADKSFHDALISWLTFHEAMLIGEVVPESLKYLRSNPTAPVLTAFDHVIVDEYQDLNRADQAMIDLIAHDNVVIVGDEDQSIYRFRYAHPQGILEYATTHPGTTDLALEEWRRCPSRIVEMANHLILHNHFGAKIPKLRPKSDNAEGSAHIVQWRTMEEEAKGFANYTKHLIDNGYSPEDILILAPRRRIAYLLRQELAAKDVAHHSYYQEEALDNDAARCACTVLTLMARPEDRVALRYWLGHGSSSWLSRQYAKLRSYCGETGLSPRSVLEGVLKNEIRIAGIGQLQKRYQELIYALARLEGKEGKDLLDGIAPEGVEDFQLLRTALLPVLQDDADAATFAERIRTVVTQPEVPEHSNYVRIMSLQKSKGLTSKVVMIAGCIEGWIPTIPEDEPTQVKAEILAEQRRLFYVAITRATEKLIISSFAAMPRDFSHQTQATTRKGFGLAGTSASRFIAELGPRAPASLTGETWLHDEYEADQASPQQAS